MTWSREMSHMSKILSFEFLTPPSNNINMLHFNANPISIGSGNRVMSNLSVLKTIWKQQDLNPFFANISETISLTSDSFLLFMSHTTYYEVHSGHVPFWLLTLLLSSNKWNLHIYFYLRWKRGKIWINKKDVSNVYPVGYQFISHWNIIGRGQGSQIYF